MDYPVELLPSRTDYQLLLADTQAGIERTEVCINSLSDQAMPLGEARIKFACAASSATVKSSRMSSWAAGAPSAATASLRPPSAP